MSFQSCVSEEKTKIDCKEINHRVYINLDSLNKEFIDFDSLKIYGKYPLKQTEKEIVERFGKKLKVYQNYRNDEKTLVYGFIRFTLFEKFFQFSDYIKGLQHCNLCTVGYDDFEVISELKANGNVVKTETIIELKK